AALIQPLFVADVAVPFLRFHPTLAPMLRAQLSAEDREHLEAAHRLRYYGLSAGLYSADSNNPTRTRSIAWMELPNLLHAAHNALDARAPYAVDFSDNIRHFVGRIFGLQNETEGLARKAETMSARLVHIPGSSSKPHAPRTFFERAGSVRRSESPSQLSRNSGMQRLINADRR